MDKVVLFIIAVLMFIQSKTAARFDHSDGRDKPRPYGFAPEAQWIFPRNNRPRRSMSMDPPPDTATRLLNSSIIPTHYDVWIQPRIYSQNHEQFFFYGRVWMYFYIREPTVQFSIHSKYLQILEYYMMQDTENGWETLSVVRAPDLSYDTLSFHTADSTPLATDQKYVLSVLYKGTYDHQHVRDTFGVFLNSYLDEAGHQQWMTVTSLQSNYARTMIPCLDEPQYKTTFSMRVSRRHWMTALSNTVKVKEERGRDGFITDQFETTMLMPSYLLAFTLFRTSDWYPAVTDAYHSMVTTLWLTRTAAAQLPPDTTIFLPGMVHFLENYFNVGIPLKKMDIMALPNFAMGGMENPGLILVQIQGITEADTYNRYLLLTHELIHQWLGNMVTPITWEHVWISEGITSHLAARCLETTHPHLTAPLEETRYYWYLRVMDFDGDEGSKSVYQRDVTDALEIFDINYVYIKGAAMTDLIEHIVGTSKFKEGVQEFLRRYRYSSAGIDDFLVTMQESSKGVFNATLFRPWMYKIGYPIIKVTTNFAEKRFTLKAYHFIVNYEISNQTLDELEEFDGQVPVEYIVQYRNGDIVKGKTVFQGTVTEKLTGFDVDFLIVNTAHQYFKVFYDDVSWGMLKAELQRNPSKFSVPALQGLLADGHLFWSAGFLDDMEMTSLSTLTCGNVPDSCLWWTEVMY